MMPIVYISEASGMAKGIVMELMLLLKAMETTAVVQLKLETAAAVGLAVVLTTVILGLIFLAIFVLFRSSNAPRVGEGAAGRSWLDYGPLIIVALSVLIVAIVFCIVVLVFYSKFTLASQVLAALTALFGVVGTLVGTYFGIKSSLDAREGAENLAKGGTTPPIVSMVSPSNGEKVSDKKPVVTATFSKAMAEATIKNDTFRLMDVTGDAPTPVPGVVALDPSSRRTTFTLTPLYDLAPGPYQATISTGAKDLEGTALAADYPWQFEVIAPETSTEEQAQASETSTEEQDRSPGTPPSSR